MTRVNKVMRRSVGAPSEWVCNAKALHDEESEECRCASCFMSIDRLLVLGTPQDAPNFSGKQLEDNGYVGLYVRKPEFYIPCGSCQKGIPISDPEHVASARSGEYVPYHFLCYPRKREYMPVSPYVLVKADEEVEEDEESSEGVRGEDGGGAEGERVQGDVEGEESGG